MRKPRSGTKPDGSISYMKDGGMREKIDGKWVYKRKHPDGFVDKWGNYSARGRGDNNPVIGKYGPRPELRSLVYGVGINDVMIAEFTSSRIWKQWNGIIRRTDNRDPVWLQTKPTYKECTLDPRWFKLSVFKEWVEQWDDYQNKEVDKDILIPNNKVYGPDTCLMVRPIVNKWFKYDFSGDLPRGVSWNTAWKMGKSPNPYRSQITPIGGKRTALGYYATIEESSAAFEKARKEQIEFLIKTETDPIVKQAMIDREFMGEFK
jgi:hypothetical protein